MFHQNLDKSGCSFQKDIRRLSQRKYGGQDDMYSLIIYINFQILFTFHVLGDGTFLHTDKLMSTLNFGTFEIKK